MKGENLWARIFEVPAQCWPPLLCCWAQVVGCLGSCGSAPENELAKVESLKVEKLKGWKLQMHWMASSRKRVFHLAVNNYGIKQILGCPGGAEVGRNLPSGFYLNFNHFCNLDFWLETVHAWLDISWIYQFQTWNRVFFTHHLCWSRLLEAIHTSVPLTGHLQKGWS